MNPRGSYIVFFDLDGTLTKMNSGYALMKTAWKGKAISWHFYTKFIIHALMYIIGILPAKKIMAEMGGWLRGIKPEVFHSLGIQSVKKYLLDSIFSEALLEIEFHKSSNAEIALLSSALAEICIPLAEELGINHVISSEMETTNGNYTGKPLGEFCYGEEKYRRMISFCSRNGFSIESAWYYADSISDLAALESIGTPVCVNPDRRLAKIAKEKGWNMRQWIRRS